MKNSTLCRSFFIAACLPLLAGCVDRGTVNRHQPPAEVFIADGAPLPPPPQTEVITVAPM